MSVRGRKLEIDAFGFNPFDELCIVPLADCFRIIVLTDLIDRDSVLPSGLLLKIFYDLKAGRACD